MFYAHNVSFILDYLRLEFLRCIDNVDAMRSDVIFYCKSAVALLAGVKHVYTIAVCYYAVLQMQ